MKTRFWIVGLLLLLPQEAWTQEASSRGEEAMDQVAAATYEHLATVIIEVRRTEDQLVKGILIGYHQAAQNRLRAAAAGRGDRRAHLEAAATQIANIANEGDARIRAIRQRLAQAGHTHNTDEATKEDYMFVDSREKKELLALAREVGGLGDEAEAEQVRGLSQRLGELFRSVIASE